MDLCVRMFSHSNPPITTTTASFECYQDECAPYVCQLQSLSETGGRGAGKGRLGRLIHVYISLWVTEHLRPEVRKKKVTLFLGGGDRWELRKVFCGEGGMDGNNILLVVSASQESYWFSANIHSFLPFFLYVFLSLRPCLPPLPIAAGHSMARSAVSPPSFSRCTAPPMCTLTPNSCSARQRASPSISVS